MRKLASIKVVSEVLPIEGKDRIVLARIDGWSVIVKKDEFKPGDLCVYVEIDSVLPEKPEFEFLRKGNFRIKTMKMAGCISQGICFPLSILPPGNYEPEQDVTELMGVKQYEGTMDVDPVQNTQKQSKVCWPKFLMRFKWFRNLVKPKKQGTEFPSFIHKTDETRIQNMPFILKDKKTNWVVTEKIDGQSGTFCLVRHKHKLPFLKDSFEYMVCSRNRKLPVKDNSSYWKVSERYDIERKLHKIIGDEDWVAIQGECVASNVQGNKYKVSEPDLYVFNIVYPNGRVGSMFGENIATHLGMKHVPILDSNFVLPDTVDEMLGYAHNQSAIGDTLREGVVIRSADGKQSFKAVDPLFLIKYNE